MKVLCVLFLIAFVTIFSFLLLLGEPGQYRLKRQKQQEGLDPRDFPILDQKYGMFGPLKVVEDIQNSRRFLISGKSFIGGIHLDEAFSSLFTVFPIISSVFFANPSAKNLLQIGLGVGIVPRKLAPNGVICDVVEIDPDVVELAKKHFYFKTNGEIIVQDGRRHLFATEKKYDLIVHDIFSAGSTASFLVTKEVFARISTLLNPGGVMAFNFFGFYSGRHFNATCHILSTLMSTFKYLRCFKDSDKIELDLGNLVCFGSMDSPIGFRIPQEIMQMNTSEWDNDWIVQHFQEFEFPLDQDYSKECEILTDKNHQLMKDLQIPIGQALWKDIRSLLPPDVWGTIYTN